MKDLTEALNARLPYGFSSKSYLYASTTLLQFEADNKTYCYVSKVWKKKYYNDPSLDDIIEDWNSFIESKSILGFSPAQTRNYINTIAKPIYAWEEEGGVVYVESNYFEKEE